MEILSRIQKIRDYPIQKGPVVYWMQRNQRVEDNWALITAQRQAMVNNNPLIVVFCIQKEFLGATRRHFQFMVKGLEEVERDLAKKNIPFVLLEGSPETVLVEYVHTIKAGCVFTDMSPLRIARQWREGVSQKISCGFFMVDTHNIVPVWVASVKKEFGAYTLRPKIQDHLELYLSEFPEVKVQQGAVDRSQIRSHRPWKEYYRSLGVQKDDNSEIDWIVPGSTGAKAHMHTFLAQRLKRYKSDRNNPTVQGVSDLSPYLHFGQLSAQRVALEVRKSDVSEEEKKVFLEELVVRRELADNFCFYEEKYDQFEGFPQWAQETLNDHRKDTREKVYTQEQFEQALTHDTLWNASQRQMVRTGKMHGFLRMYWAKKILEWTKSPEEALKIAIYLNDTYSLDGRDPNGYTGIAWSIGGVHDRVWFDRPVFGKIRYMNYNGCKKKFDVKSFEETWKQK